jgi:DNA-binding HxlR family transcriptional regulator
MYQRKIEDDFGCGIITSLRVFGAKWKPCIINAVGMGIRRPSEIHRAIPITSPRVIDMQLRELVAWGILEKQVQTGFPLYVEYFLTDFGNTILPLVVQMREWGQRNREQVIERYSQMQLTAALEEEDR